MQHENNEKLTELLCRWKRRVQGRQQSAVSRHQAGSQPHAIPVIISVNNHITMPRHASPNVDLGSRDSRAIKSETVETVIKQRP